MIKELKEHKDVLISAMLNVETVLGSSVKDSQQEVILKNLMSRLEELTGQTEDLLDQAADQRQPIKLQLNRAALESLLSEDAAIETIVSKQAVDEALKRIMSHNPEIIQKRIDELGRIEKSRWSNKDGVVFDQVVADAIKKRIDWEFKNKLNLMISQTLEELELADETRFTRLVNQAAKLAFDRMETKVIAQTEAKVKKLVTDRIKDIT